MATYYVDATGGADGNTGLSPADAWQTIGKVNASSFNAGDSILFKRGETWTGTCLIVPSSGSAGSPIMFADYGSGAKPVIDGNDTVNCIQCNGKHYLTFHNLDCTQGLDFGINCDAVHDITVTDCDCHDCGNDNLIFINTCYDCLVVVGNFYNGYDRVGGQQVTGIEIADGSHDITIRGASCYDQIDTGAGISIHSHVLKTMPYNLVIENCDCYGNAGSGIRLAKADATADTDRNIIIRDCVVRANTLDGIVVNPPTGGQYINGVDVLCCKALLNLRWGLSYRGDDIVTRNCIVTTANEGAQTAVALDGINGGAFENNTLYATFVSFFGIFQIANARTANLNVRNNIIAASGTNPYMVAVAAGTGVASLVINYNLYSYTAAANRWTWLGANTNYAGWQAAGLDANSPARAAPSFVDVTNFYLQHGSPALNVGTPIAGRPFYGAAPDCGRWEMRWPSTRAHQLLVPAWKFT